MRKLIYVINHSIDGYCDLTIGAPGEDLFDFFINLIRGAGLSIYGRTTYEIMVPYWPDIAKNPAGETKADVEYAEAFDAMEKVVFSKSLEKVESKNTRLVNTNAADEIVKLKQQEGSYMLVGGVALASSLIEQGLVDEYILVVLPIIVGGGTKLFNGISLPKKLKLKLVDTKVFESGCVLHHYAK
jgi:dihydrofolate reductase